jgi:hypothetical protein
MTKWSLIVDVSSILAYVRARARDNASFAVVGNRVPRAVGSRRGGPAVHLAYVRARAKECLNRLV